VSAGVTPARYLLDTLGGSSPDRNGEVPPTAMDEAPRAPAAGLSLDEVLGRYMVWHQALLDHLGVEARHDGFAQDVLLQLRRAHQALLGPLLRAVEREYVRKHERHARSPEERRAEIANRLLSGSALDAGELAELDHEIHTRWHLGLVAAGGGAERTLRRLLGCCGCEPLLVVCDNVTWAWVSGRHSAMLATADRLCGPLEVDAVLAVGEPAKGLAGWCLTHRQARAALAVAIRKSGRVALYSDNRLLAAALQNDTLAKSLEQRYVRPLRDERDEGLRLRQTLRAYIDIECNASSAAHRLKIGRRAVKSRITRAETLIGVTLRECLAELDVALCLAELAEGE